MTEIIRRKEEVKSNQDDKLGFHCILAIFETFYSHFNASLDHRMAHPARVLVIEEGSAGDRIKILLK